MAIKSNTRLKFARRRECITDYKKRHNMLKGGLPRLVVRQTNKKILAQVVSFTDSGDLVLATALSSDLGSLGWKHSVKSIPSAYLTGILISTRAKSKNIKTCVLDVGLKTLTKGSRIFAVLKGAVDGGLEIPHSAENFPGDDRINGKHIADYKKTDISKDFASMKEKVSGAAATAVKEAPKKKPAAKKQ